MRPMEVRWHGRVIARDGTEFPWASIDPPEAEIIMLCVKHSAAVRVTYPDGSSIEYAVEGVADVGPAEARSHRY